MMEAVDFCYVFVGIETPERDLAPRSDRWAKTAG
jgi:hypothetical protein